MRKLDANAEHIILEIEDIIRKKKIKRVVIDSINLLTMIPKMLEEKREMLAKLCNMLSSLGCTSLLLSETRDEDRRISEFGIEEYIVDGVVVLYHLKQGTRFVPGIAIRKLRGSSHDHDIRPYDITAHGLIVYPEEVMFMGDGR